MATREYDTESVSSFRSLPICLSRGLREATKGEPCVEFRPGLYIRQDRFLNTTREPGPPGLAPR